MAAKKLMAFLSVLIIAIVIVSIFMSGLMDKSKEETITPADSPELLDRGFFMGILPFPRYGQSFEEAYSQAAQYSEFSPVWGKARSLLQSC